MVKIKDSCNIHGILIRTEKIKKTHPSIAEEINSHNIKIEFRISKIFQDIGDWARKMDIRCLGQHKDVSLQLGRT